MDRLVMTGAVALAVLYTAAGMLVIGVAALGYILGTALLSGDTGFFITGITGILAVLAGYAGIGIFLHRRGII